MTLPPAFGFGAVLLPRTADCPGVVTLSPAVVSDISSTNSTSLELGFYAPWRLPATNGVRVIITAVPGLLVNPSSLVLPGKVVITAPNASKGYYFLNISGEGVLPTRRWVRVVSE